MMKQQTQTPCPHCGELVYVLSTQCVHCRGPLRFNPAVQQGSLEAYRILTGWKPPVLPDIDKPATAATTSIETKPAGQRKRRTKPQMPRIKVEAHWREVMVSGNRDLIQEYLTLGEIALAKKIGTSRGTLRKCECFKNRRIALREFNRENG